MEPVYFPFPENGNIFETLLFEGEGCSISYKTRKPKKCVRNALLGLLEMGEEGLEPPTLSV
jgi:hypothetical protein